MMQHEQGEPIELREMRQTRRSGLLRAEMRGWFYPLFSFVAFLAVGCATILAIGGYTPGARTYIGGAIAGTFAGVAVHLGGMARKRSFYMTRQARRIERVEKELERFVIVILRELRLPLRSLRETVQEAAEELDAVPTGAAGSRRAEAAVRSGGNGDCEAGQPQVRRQLELAASKIGQIDGLASGLLRVARARRATLHRDWLDVNSLVIGVVQEFQELVDRTGASVQMRSLPSCLADGEFLRQAFRELVSNALHCRHPRRAPEVRIWGWMERGRPFYCVQDNGVGMEEDQFDKIFEMFYRIPPAHGIGHGIGLTVVRRIVEQHGGRIWLKSTPGKGTTFTFSV